MTILGSVCGDADNPCPHSIIPGVWGRCPACGNRSLGLHGQVVQCDHRGCPDPLAAAKTLDLDHRHVLDVRDDGWSIEHPVACVSTGGFSTAPCTAWSNKTSTRVNPPA